ncbi:hypothetical protein HNQ59_000578 [Chitinivorax tropicus]|uniref:DUF721 domain-containing protein n=2 Tax=Chitinivorax tropicus TaxID=714531 RepID=A0A840MDC8_9PROT|nr:hypothetical protein [Chitinivorax tropicus]
MSVFKQAERMLAIHRRVASLLPAQGNGLQVVRWDGSVLVIFAENAAIATRVRQQVPSLLKKLAGAGFGATDIRIKVSVVEEKPMQPKHAQMSDAALASLAELADAVKAPEVRDKLDALLQRQLKQRSAS